MESIVSLQDVYAVDFDFREMTRFIVDTLDSECEDATIEEAVNTIREVIGRDPVKLFGLIDVVHDKIARQRSWATGAAVRFYKIFFLELDFSFVDETDFEDGATGTQLVVQCIIDNCTAELNKTGDWTSDDVKNTLDFVDEAFGAGGNFVTTIAVSSIINSLATSEYLIFGDNLSVFAEFCLCLLPRINALGATNDYQELRHAWKALLQRKKSAVSPVTPGQIRVIDELASMLDAFSVNDEPDAEERSSTYKQPYMEEISFANTAEGDSFVHRDEQPPFCYESRHASDQDLFALQRDWSCPEVTRFLAQISENTKIGASEETQHYAFAIIETMVQSDVVFFGTNLHTLSFFLLRVAPVLDGMANPSPSTRLTSLLRSLRMNPHDQASHHLLVIDGLCHNLGR